jgi:hypothetical protein
MTNEFNEEVKEVQKTFPDPKEKEKR